MVMENDMRSSLKGKDFYFIFFPLKIGGLVYRSNSRLAKLDVFLSWFYLTIVRKIKISALKSKDFFAQKMAANAYVYFMNSYYIKY